MESLGIRCLRGATGVAFVVFLAGCNSNYFSPLPQSVSGGADAEEGLAGGVTPEGISESGTPDAFDQSNCALKYPVSTSVAATNVPFNESEILAAFSPQFVASAGYTINAWYTDEHAMILGIREIQVTTASGTTSTDYAVSPLTASPSAAANPQVGATALTGDQAGVDTSTCSGSPDACSRPLYPAAFITDITSDAASTSGDWQYGGTPYLPDGVYGTWKSAVRVVDKTQTPPAVSVVSDADPTPNQWNLGSGVPAPTGIPTEGYTAVVSWESSHLGLLPGHTYRIQFMIHDGDQNHSGGDVGENCVNITVQ